MKNIPQKQVWDKYYSHILNEAVTKKRINKLFLMYKIICKGLNKPLEKVNRSDIEVFMDSLNKDTFLKINGDKYSGSTKSDIKKFIKQFYKWLKGDNEFYPKEVSWIKTKIGKDEKPKEKPVISVEELLKLVSAIEKPIYKIMTLLLFDSGFRIDEMFSVRKCDITFEEFDDNDKCFWIKCSRSKTELRKVPIPLFTEDIKTFCNSSQYMSLKETDLIFNFGYPTYTSLLKHHSLKLFGKDRILTPHSLRHSSATYYAKEYSGNTMMLAQRYGWTFNSKELQIYIRRSGTYNRLGAKKSYENEVTKLKKKVIDMEEENDNVKRELEKINKVMQYILFAHQNKEKLKVKMKDPTDINELINLIRDKKGS